MNILDKIVAAKQHEVAVTKAKMTEAALRAQAEGRTDFRDFKAALCRRGGVTLIAEVKKASPSAGMICSNFDPVGIAKQYEQGGASAISVLTDGEFFQGKLEYLHQIREQVRLPLLRKDFIIEEYQIYESVAAGADAILLIVAILDFDRLKRLLTVARQSHLGALVEIHDEEEREIAQRAGAEIIGINNRNLKDFTVHLSTTERLAEGIEEDCVVVAESGIHARADVERLRAAGVDAILVGESLMRSGNIAAKMKELLGP